MANMINLITKYLTDAYDGVMAVESRTSDLENGNKFVNTKFDKAGYVEIASILTDGLSDYHRANGTPVPSSTDYAHYNASGTGTNRDGYAVGGASLTWELKKLEYDRGKQFQIDRMDDEETAGLMMANLFTEFFKTKVVPEIDESRFSRIAEHASATLGNLIVDKTIEANKVIEDLNNGFEWLAEHEVPEEEQIIYASPKTITLMRNSTEMVKFITQDDLKKDVDFTVFRYMGRRVVEVPSNRFFTDAKFGSNGFYPTAKSKIINYMIVSKRAVVPVVKLEDSKVFGPEVVQDFDGYKINFRLYHDTIIPKNKIVGVYCSVSAVDAKTKTSKLDVAISWDGSKNVVDAYFTTPVGIRGKLVHQQAEMKLGTAYPSAEELHVGVPYTKKNANEYYAILDDRNVAIAVSALITPPQA